jgi:hypothetical protein
MTVFIVLLAILSSVTFAQNNNTEYCNVRCDVDAQCGGTCGRCSTTTDDQRVCLGASECGGQCNSDDECGKLCSQCINGACGGLPCHADCEKSAWCGEECGACLPSAFNNNRTVCTQACGAPCISSLGCAEPCPHCGEDGVCEASSALSAGAVVGITIAVALVGGGILFPLVIMGIMCWCLASENDGYAGLAVVYITAFCIPVGIIVFALAFGLSLGLSPSICCA